MRDRNGQDIPETAPCPPGLAGRALKHFRLESVVGEGGMGVVYRAHDTKLHRSVAVKLLPPELTSDGERRQRFLQEARAAARITHPAVAQIYHVDEEDDLIFIAMELVDGKTVHQLIRDRELDLLGALDIAIQVADGLAKAHELGIVHRDIKPSNVMVTPDGHAKILDFGLAKLLQPFAEFGPGGTRRVEHLPEAMTQSSVIMGTPAYMSPEQVRGATVDGRTDIFSLGSMLFEMVTSKPAFDRGNFMDTLHAVAYDEVSSLLVQRTGLPPDLQRIVVRCLHKRSEDRYPDARTLAEELRRSRRNLEAGVLQKTTWGQRLADWWETMRSLKPSQYAWMALGLVGLWLALDFSLSKMGAGGLAFGLIIAFSIYRHVRNRPQQVQELFVRRATKIPEVQMILIRDRHITVVVEPSSAQLHNRITSLLRTCNRRLYMGEPLTVTVREKASPEETRQMLGGPGVEYVRE